MPMMRCFPCVCLVLVLMSTTAVAEESFSPEQLEFFEKQVRPILIERCHECHGPETQEGSLRLDSRAAILKGGETGPAVVPGKPDQGELIEAIGYDPDGYQMPPDGKLPAGEIEILTRWVRMGAPWPSEEVEAAAAAAEFDLQARAEHWSFQPLEPVELPQVADEKWSRSGLDRFLLSKLEREGFSPASEADRRTWIRRASLDVTGIPPTPAEVREFLNDPAPDAHERVVDRLLASPRFGERWGRHWLDLVRYAESRGHEFDYNVVNPWHYRDYVIRAFNDDLPYDRWVVEHVAGDLLVDANDSSLRTNPPLARFPQRRHPATGANESILGTGFWFLGEWVHSPVDIRQEEADRFDNMIDVYSKTFLGLTVACARCHDHKFDPITQKDFYALQGYLRSSSYQQARFETMEQNREIAAKLDALDREFGERLTALAGIDPGRVRSDDSGSAQTQISSRELIPAGVGFQLIEAGKAVFDGTGERPRLIEHPFEAVYRYDPLWFRLDSPPGTLQEPGALDGWNRGGRMLRTPTFELQSGRIFALVRGHVNTYVAVDSHILVKGPLHGALAKKHETESAGWRWIEHRVNGYESHRAHLELIPQPGPDNESPVPFAVAAIVQADELTDEMKAAVARTQEPTAVQTVAFEEEAGPEQREQLERLQQEYRRRREELVAGIRTTSHTAPCMLEGTPEEEYVFIRGSWKRRGETVPRRFLEVFGGTSTGPAASDAPLPERLDLALRMIDPEQTPILPRVIVNRIWKGYFGRGIVPTPDDFGHLGQEPTHPELLDWLANELVRRDWSMKAIHREILLSSAYRMSSDVSESISSSDPDNLLFHRMNVKRLEGEIIRDSILAVSGRLDERMYGVSVPIHLTAFLEGRGRPGESGPIDGNGRRSIYLSVRRNFPEPLLQAFDFPNPHSTIGRRNVSNVPAQALALMNNPLIVQQSRVWADRLLAERPQAEVGERINQLFETAFARPASKEELAVGERFLHTRAKEQNTTLDDPRLWADYCHVLLNLKEFIFIR
jgi:hypothetical protein